MLQFEYHTAIEPYNKETESMNVQPEPYITESWTSFDMQELHQKTKNQNKSYFWKVHSSKRSTDGSV